MKLNIEGERIEQIVFDYAVSICTEKGGFLQIESAFSLQKSPNDQPCVYVPERSKDIGEILPYLLHATVKYARTDDMGNLTIELKNGTRVHVPFDRDYEAWNFVNRSDFRIVASASGGLTVWQGDD